MGKGSRSSASKGLKWSAFCNNFYLLSLIWRICPWRVIHSFLSSLVGFGCWVFYSVIFMRYLFGAAEMTRTFPEVLTFVLVSLGVMCLVGLYNCWYWRRHIPMTDQKLIYGLNRMMFDKAASVDISCYENPDFYDDYTRAATETAARASSVLSSTANFIGSLLSSFYVMATMYSINKVVAFFAFLPVLGTLVIGKFQNKLIYQREQEQVSDRRRQDYVNRAVYLQKFANEVRLTSIYRVLRGTYTAAHDSICKTIDRFFPKILALDATKGIICFPLVFEGTWFYAAYCAMVPKTIAVGDFVVLASAIVSTTWMLIDFANSITECYKNGLYIENLKRFLQYKPKIDEGQKGLMPQLPVKTIEFRDVSFRYEGQEEDCLSHVSFLLHSGQKYALVGHNGSGKSTLVKLLMRLYDPTQGVILLNGVDIRQYNLKAYRRLIGATFQDYAIFSMTVLENAAMHSIEGQEQREAVLQALRQSGAYEKVMSLPDGPDTILTKEFDDNGAVLSGGEFQKIAVARAFARQSPVVVLDEPSSALDPIAEYQMYETILALCERCDPKQGKISVIISHRLSSAAMADQILFLRGGKLAECGTHKQLMQAKGLYADMFIKQAKNYLQDEALA